MSEETISTFTTWSANDYSNFITICAAAVGSTLLVLFKSRCSTISFCWGLYKCNREVLTEDSDNEGEALPAPNLLPAPINLLPDQNP